MTPIVRLQRVDWADRHIPLPIRQTPHAAGMDLRANLAPDDRAGGISIAPRQHSLIPLGFIMQLPEGFEGQIRPRSGLALKHGVTVLNAPGTIDSDYRGEVGVLLANLGGREFTVMHGDRIAQLIVAAVTTVEIAEVGQLSESRRGAGGFGSTGIR
ncbi:MAG: dUTP diphosphatase [Rhodobacteraceae bacterium]|nr:dUTP diphosphatase [Paracoccaceae bacterium]